MPEQAVRAPRFGTAHHLDSFDPNPDREGALVQAGSLTVNADISEEVRTKLTDRGHDLAVTEGAIAAPVMLYIDRQSGTFYAAGDPAAGRHAAALD
jgi:gamma-glutamyltranspeptidase